MKDKKIISIKQKLIPVIMVRRVLEKICFFIFKEGRWQKLELALVKAIYFKPYLIWLIDSEDTLFKMLTFPADILQKKELKEAVWFEVQNFSPWGKDTDMYYFPILDGMTWRVQVWIWKKQKGVESELQSLGLWMTHVIPEHALCLSSLADDVRVYFLQKQRGNIDAVSVSSNGYSVSIQELHDKQSLLLFCHKAKCHGKSKVMMQNNLDTGDVLPDWMATVEYGSDAVSKLKFNYIHAGQFSGSRVWWNLPQWKAPLLLLGAMLFLVGMGQYILIKHEEKLLQARYDVAMGSANHVLDYRKRIEKDQNILNVYRIKKHSQQRLFIVLDYLSRNLPADIRIKGVQYLAGILTLNGLGLDVAGLPALLEKSDLIKRSEFMGPIHLDALTKKEKFILRIFMVDKQ